MDIIIKPRKVLKKAVFLPYISILVKEQRIKLGLSQDQLAKKIGIGLKTLRKIEQGDLNLNFHKVNFLLNFFGMELQPVELLTSPKIKSKKKLKKNDILKILKNIYPILKLKYGINELALFGSYAKGNATSESDIDILINSDSTLSLEVEGEIQLIFENIFPGTRVDLTLKNNLHNAFRKEIKESKINVTERL